MHFFEKIYLDCVFAPREKGATHLQIVFSTTWRTLLGMVLSCNFVLFWAVPIFGMGQVWKLGASKVLAPLFNVVDNSSVLRSFARKYIYTTDENTDFFLASLLTLISITASFLWLLRLQWTHGQLSWFSILLYNCIWVGLGGRTMGIAYTMAHKEGHTPRLYHKRWHAHTGNIFENWIGLLYGNVPHNFSTSHMLIHHATNGSIGDTFYLWDLDRTSLSDFMIYLQRILNHCSGWSSYQYFNLNGYPRAANKLLNGMIVYFIYAPIALTFLSNGSLSFVWWVYFEPFLCMSFFLALINVGFHAFLEINPKTREPVEHICATCIVDGEDDSFGEDDHMTHHNAPQINHRGLKAFQNKQSKTDNWVKGHASVFHTISIVELSILVVIGQFDRLADFYVDYSGKLSKDEIKKMLKERATLKQMQFSEYLERTSKRTLPLPESRKAK